MQKTNPTTKQLQLDQVYIFNCNPFFYSVSIRFKCL